MENSQKISWMQVALEAKYWMLFYSKMEGDYNEQKFKEYCEKYDEAMSHLNPNYKPMGESIDEG